MKQLHSAAFALLLLGSSAFATDSLFLAGAATVDLDMPKGTPIAGYGGLSRREFNPFKKSRYSHFLKVARGVHDPVRAKAAVLQLNEKKMVWVSVDLIALAPEMLDYVAEKVSSLGFSKENILISATHTHSGPGAFTPNKFWSFVAVDKFRKKIFEHISDKIVATIVGANNQLTPAVLGVGQVRIDGVTENRRGAPFLDPVATVIKVDRWDGAPITTVFSFPIHCTVFGPGNLSLSSDVCGAIERRIEQDTGAAAIFLNGDEGDVAPVRTGNGPDDSINILANTIGQAITQQRNVMGTHIPSNIRQARTTLELPKARFNLNCLSSGKKYYIGIGSLMPRSAPFHGVLIDDTLFVTIPGEVIAELGLQIKDFANHLGYSKVAVVGLTNHYLGYILTSSEFDKGGLEPCGSLYGGRLGQWVVDSAEKTITSLSSDR